MPITDYSVGYPVLGSAQHHIKRKGSTSEPYIKHYPVASNTWKNEKSKGDM